MDTLTDGHFCDLKCFQLGYRWGLAPLRVLPERGLLVSQLSLNWLLLRISHRFFSWLMALWSDATKSTTAVLVGASIWKIIRMIVMPLWSSSVSVNGLQLAADIPLYFFRCLCCFIFLNWALKQVLLSIPQKNISWLRLVDIIPLCCEWKVWLKHTATSSITWSFLKE